MAKVSKEGLIKEWGHCLVLCDRHNGHLYPLTQADRYWVGNLEVGWSPNVPDAFVIKEFLGRLPYGGDSSSIHITNPRTTMQVASVEAGRERLSEVQQAIGKMFADIRGTKVSKALTFSTETPTVPVELDLLPAEIEVGNLQLFKNGARIHCLPMDVMLRPLEVHECEIKGAQLSAVPEVSDDRARWSERYAYELEVMMDVPDTLGAADAYTVVRKRFAFDPEGVDTSWRYSASSHDFQGGMLYCLSRESAEAAARTLAVRTLANIQGFLPKKADA